VGNDQIDEPWIDESLTQYMTMLYFLDVYGEQGEEGFRDSFYRRWDSIDGADIPIGLPAGEYEGSEYSGIIYGRGPLFFDALAEEMGEESFNAFLHNYYQANKWGISSGATIKAAAEEACGCDLSAIFAEWIGDL
jgi:aminopeptidase N